MELTEEMLRELELPEEAAERIWQAHRETVDALRAEAESARGEVQRLNEAEQRRAAEEALRGELRRLGAQEEAIPLLTMAALPQAVMAGGRLQNAQALLAPLRRQYPGLFPEEPTRPPAAWQPGCSGREAISAMSEGEINARWDEVREMLRSP